jgi:hypothetical protein
MTFWELMGITLSAVGLFASILGAFLTYAARKNGEATRELIRSMEERMTRHFSELIRSNGEATQELIRSMEERTTKHFSELLERMDQRADERQREVIETIRALRAA